MVRSIRECDGDAKGTPGPNTICKKSTDFSYEAGDDRFQLVTGGSNPVNDIATSTDPRFWRMIVADLNNDGRDDILYRNGRDWKYSLSKCQADLMGCGFDKGTTLNIASTLAGNATTAKPYDPLIVDWDLDGKPDLAGINPNTPTTYTYFRGAGTSFSTSFSDDSSSLLTSLFVISTAGKGLPTLLRTRGNLWSFWQVSEQAWVNAGPTWHEPEPLKAWNFYAADINGDGRTELLRRESPAKMRLVSTADTTLPISEPGGTTRKHYFTDLNGDGISDAIQLVSGINGPRTIINTGNGFKHPVSYPVPADATITTTAGTQWMDLTDPGIRLLDFDGDGRQDILLVDDGRTRAAGVTTNNPTRPTMRVLLSRNAGFERKDLGVSIGKAANGEPGRDLPAAGAVHSNWLLSQTLDANGDGQMDIALVNISGGLDLYLRIGKPRDPGHPQPARVGTKRTLRPSVGINCGNLPRSGNPPQ
jgi:hypothetical protein